MSRLSEKKGSGNNSMINTFRKNNTINTFHMAKARGNLALRTVYCMLVFFSLNCVSVWVVSF